MKSDFTNKYKNRIQANNKDFIKWILPPLARVCVREENLTAPFGSCGVVHFINPPGGVFRLEFM